MDLSVFLPLAALALDAALGDPHGWPHPVRWIGRLLDALERPAQLLPVDSRRYVYGAFCAFLLPLGAYTAAWFLVRLPGVGAVASLYLAYAGLALGQLVREARAVAALIDAGDLAGARVALGMLVSRDTSRLDEAGLWRTLAETVSENFCDAFAAPAFYLALGGAPLLWLYKTVSTMDSMWGYTTQRFKALGWGGAKADDVLAWLPARLSALALIAAGAVLGLPSGAAWRNTPTDARRMASPNAGWPMAAAAWLCGASMGGEAVYFGKRVDKPLLGPAGRAWGAEQCKTLMRLVYTAAIVLIIALILLLMAFAFAFS